MFLKNVLYIKPFFDFLLPFILASSVSDLKTDIMRGLELSYYFADDPDLAAWFLTNESAEAVSNQTEQILAGNSEILQQMNDLAVSSQNVHNNANHMMDRTLRIQTLAEDVNTMSEKNKQSIEKLNIAVDKFKV
ncbi:methyl-accepting chemotaxis protein [Treponema phagedenis]|uniref:Methyl-accepting chemotaxis protein n=1 Tax=Treponema phagedenis TaxID=162 RepID=A0AAE6IT74_TREPH|nr:methyl-accepting chemotaxis protein [Treponema phagedenis]QEJ97835.1 methyl-accepting chemotaxis protein [Treponema phagedenis]QEK00751.1 methyl-accepting chemotaxis protein [Treponema phagedenis]QEK05758.1 methyl-accepting chemotaxis protein [Treponema phagedenis]QLC57485.1 methyl-accepting chemotaxis protein [Treponema phagedenis]